MRDNDVSPALNAVVTTLAERCAVLETQWRAPPPLDEKRRTRTSEDVRLAAEAMLRTAEAALPAGAFIAPVNVSLAFDPLPEFERPDRF